MQQATPQITPTASKVSARTRWSYGLGCIGRDATYTLVSNFILTYLTLAVGLTNWQLGAVGVIMIVARVWDAINDPMMGTIIDNTNTRWGKFKPYIICGALLNSFFTLLLFNNPAKSEGLFVVVFAITYILWGMTFTMNDISYWSMLPSLTVDRKDRERVSSVARIGANIGLFVVTAAVPLLTSTGRMGPTYRSIAIAVVALFIACQLLVIWGVQEKPNAITSTEGRITLGAMVKNVFANDQLLAIIVSILLFNIGYFTTTSFGVQFFYFDYGNYGGIEFMIFALTIGVTQVVTLAFYNKLAAKFSRPQLFLLAICMVVLGYIGFMGVGYILPMNMVMLCIIGLVLFSGQAIIQLLNLVLLADTVEYGQWKLGVRTESINFSLNPFITKLASAVQAGIFTFTMAISGLNGYSRQLSELEQNTQLTKEQINAKANELVQTIPPSATLTMRLSMIVLPLLLIILCYVVYRTKYKIDDKMYTQIISDLEQRAQTQENQNV